MAGRRRDLSAQERELWRRVTESARPLIAASEHAPDAAPPSPQGPDGDARAEGAGRRRPPAGPSAAHPAAPPIGTIDRRTEQRLGRGAIAVDGRLDLHGLTQARAHAELRHFLASAQKRGWRTVLVITGKGGPEATWDHDKLTGAGRGVLNRQVPLWLNDSELRPFVSSFGAAHRRHGGRGALYVRIRRLR